MRAIFGLFWTHNVNTNNYFYCFMELYYFNSLYTYYKENLFIINMRKQNKYTLFGT